MHKFVGLTLAIVFAANLIVSGIPVDKSAPTTTTTIVPADDNSTGNGTHKELYVIKATTYEIGILADVPDNDTTTANGSVTRQQVDLSFFNTESNDSFINFGDVPLPVHTNVSGQIITGIAPVHIGAVSDVGDILQSLPFSGTIVNITQSDQSFVHVNRENISDVDLSTKLEDDSDLSKLPILNNVLLPNSFDEAVNSVTEKKEN
jgi:hypothetical protein